MNLANPAQARPAAAGMGALLGTLAGLLSVELGFSLSSGIQSHVVVLGWLIVGAMAGFAGRARLVVVADAILVAAYLIIAFSPAVSRDVPPWVRIDPLPPTADAIVVLSSNVQSDSALDGAGLERLLTGVELLDRGAAPRIVTSRVAEMYPQGMVSTDSDQHRILTIGHATRRWDVIDSVYSTRDEALHSAKLLFPQAARSIILVTSPMHTRRACATFEAVGFKVTCRPAREHDEITWHPQTPAQQIAAFRYYLYERLGMIKYRHKGWLPPGV